MSSLHQASILILSLLCWLICLSYRPYLRALKHWWLATSLLKSSCHVRLVIVWLFLS